LRRALDGRLARAPTPGPALRPSTTPRDYAPGWNRQRDRADDRRRMSTRDGRRRDDDPQDLASPQQSAPAKCHVDADTGSSSGAGCVSGAAERLTAAAAAGTGTARKPAARRDRDRPPDGLQARLRGAQPEQYAAHELHRRSDWGASCPAARSAGPASCAALAPQALRHERANALYRQRRLHDGLAISSRRRTGRMRVFRHTSCRCLSCSRRRTEGR
jgi:hypothetical protein